MAGPNITLLASEPAPEPGPLAVVGAQLDPIKHTHLCPICFENVACHEYCATEFVGEEIHGTPDPCDDCKNAPADSIDIMTGKIDHGDVLRCDEDALVYEVRRIDRHDQRAELETLPGYPKKARTMRLALDGSPARRSFTDDRREPLWFRVTK